MMEFSSVSSSTLDVAFAPRVSTFDFTNATDYSIGIAYMKGECSINDVQTYCLHSTNYAAMFKNIANACASVPASEAVPSRVQPRQTGLGEIMFEIEMNKQKAKKAKKGKKTVKTVETVVAPVVTLEAPVLVEAVPVAVETVESPIVVVPSTVVPSVEKTPVPIVAPVTSKPRVGMLASEIEEAPQEWLWQGWIPRGYLTMFAGDSGIGKSSVLRSIVRSLTRGEKLPDGQTVEPQGVIWISYEESTVTTLVPRLREAGVDLSKVKIMSMVAPDVRKLGEPSERPFNFPADIPVLRQAIEDAELNCGLIVVDPVMQMSDRSMSHNQTVRKLLIQLQQVAQDYSIGFLMVAHLNKGRNPSIRMRMGGSKALYDFPRAVIAASVDTNDSLQSVMWMDKHSLSGDVPSLTFERLQGGMVRFIDGQIAEEKPNYEEAEAVRTDAAIISFLESRSSGEYQGRQVAYGIGVNYECTRKALQRLAQANRIEHTTRGWYRANSGQFVPTALHIVA